MPRFLACGEHRQRSRIGVLPQVIQLQRNNAFEPLRLERLVIDFDLKL